MRIVQSVARLMTIVYSLRFVSKISIFLSLSAYTVSGNAITARNLFVVSSYFNATSRTVLTILPLFTTLAYVLNCEIPLNITQFNFPTPICIFRAESSVSIERVQDFLLKPESKLQQKMKCRTGTENKNEKNSIESNRGSGKNLEVSETIEEKDKLIERNQQTTGERIQNIDCTEKFIRFEKVTAAWERTEGESNGIFDVSFDIEPGLWSVVGRVGAGKSSLLNVILGELDLDAGTLRINGKLSYASH